MRGTKVVYTLQPLDQDVSLYSRETWGSQLGGQSFTNQEQTLLVVGAVFNISQVTWHSQVINFRRLDIHLLRRGYQQQGFQASH